MMVRNGQRICNQKLRKMAAIPVLDSQDIRELIDSLRKNVDKISLAYDSKDRITLEMCTRTLEEQARITLAISTYDQRNGSSNTMETETLSAGFRDLAETLVTLMHKLVLITETWTQQPAEELRYARKMKSTGGRPAYYIEKDLIEQLRETGMTWIAILRFIGVSEKTLSRKRSELGVEEGFSDISDDDLDREITHTLELTPYSGEIYVWGSLKGKGIKVQRSRVRESLRRIDGIGSALRTRYAIYRRKYNVAGANHLWHIDSNHKLISRRLSSMAVWMVSAELSYTFNAARITRPALYLVCSRMGWMSLVCHPGYVATKEWRTLMLQGTWLPTGGVTEVVLLLGEMCIMRELRGYGLK